MPFLKRQRILSENEDDIRTCNETSRALRNERHDQMRGDKHRDTQTTRNGLKKLSQQRWRSLSRLHHARGTTIENNEQNRKRHHTHARKITYHEAILIGITQRTQGDHLSNHALSNAATSRTPERRKPTSGMIKCRRSTTHHHHLSDRERTNASSATRNDNTSSSTPTTPSTPAP
jgi:hypothetical protein